MAVLCDFIIRNRIQSHESPQEHIVNVREDYMNHVKAYSKRLLDVISGKNCSFRGLQIISEVLVIPILGACVLNSPRGRRAHPNIVSSHILARGLGPHAPPPHTHMKSSRL
jgi:hypothetical protein